MLSIVDVSKTYPNGVKALRGVSLEVGPGETAQVLHADRIGRTGLTWIRAADHSRESAGFVASGKHFFDTPQAAVA